MGVSRDTNSSCEPGGTTVNHSRFLCLCNHLLYRSKGRLRGYPGYFTPQSVVMLLRALKLPMLQGCMGYRSTLLRHSLRVAHLMNRVLMEVRSDAVESVFTGSRRAEWKVISR